MINVSLKLSHAGENLGPKFRNFSTCKRTVPITARDEPRIMLPGPTRTHTCLQYATRADCCLRDLKGTLVLANAARSLVQYICAITKSLPQRFSVGF